MNQYEAHNAALRIDGYYTPPRDPEKVEEAFVAAKSDCLHHMQSSVGHVAQMTTTQFLLNRRAMTAAEIGQAHVIALRQAGADSLLAEVARRGLLVELEGAIGALYDHLERTGALDGESNLTPYLAYRLRREEARLSDVAAGRDGDGGRFWQQKIDALESDGTSDGAAQARPAPPPPPAGAPRVLVVITGNLVDVVSDPVVDVKKFDWYDWAEGPTPDKRLPDRFADLAQPLGVPLQGEESEEVSVRPREGA
ncbi:MAG TPA: hypothetical protein VN259_17260 [Xanthomonadales bacterium]|nr:hypothetical protein [Xanthomonadales bacterium]